MLALQNMAGDALKDGVWYNISFLEDLMTNLHVCGFVRYIQHCVEH